ncbi:MAG: pantoate--beta-alanine ligase [Beijerinckiaceae bacterium]|nr:pantoate--beta-alanine ligase [Beijerinckiaceae bacterium]MCI0737331.1 pantoate--beta-alanine ligase [Beijerinckiaceae bacterium]
MSNPAESSAYVAHDAESLRARLAEWRSDGDSIALVPTMGALHAGHIALVHEARKHARRTVMSIFVNPVQFAPSEDFGAYPRSFARDASLFQAAGGDLLFAPRVEDMYGDGFATTITLLGPAAAGLEDRYRPTHFAGVAIVVAKLLNQCRPDVAIFGEKDYQQLKAVTRMARDLDFETRILGVPTMREADGLALSSRNVYLSPAERAAAPRLYAALRQCASGINDGIGIEPALEAARGSLEEAGFVTDYFEARHAETLRPIRSPGNEPIRLLAAAWLGKTRLIDNIAV